MTKLEKLRNTAAENPVFLLFMAACPAMGASAGLKSAVALGLTVLIISFISVLIMSLIRNYLAEWAIIWAEIIISAGLASVAQLIIEAFAPGIYPALSLYIAVCALSLMIFPNSRQGMKAGIKSSLLFLAAIAATALIREFLGNASLWGHAVHAMDSFRISMLSKAPGGFIVFSVILAIINLSVQGKRRESK